MKKLLFWAALAALGWGAGYYFFFRKVPAEYELRTAKADRGDITATVTASGKLNAVSVVEVGTQVSGTIQEIYADYNSIVREGQLIARLDPAVLHLQLVESRASLEVAEAGLGSSRAALTDAERKLRRSKELYARKLISKSELEDSETEVLLKRAQAQEAKARVTQAKAAAERAETNLNFTRITSPIDGIVVSRKIDVGQTVAASFQTPTLFSIARDLTRMQIDASVDEADIGRVAEGQDADFYVDAFPGELFIGTVVQVRIAPETTDSVVTYTVVIRVENSGLRLKPGMTANISIKTAGRKGVVRIPAAALRLGVPRDLDIASADVQPAEGVLLGPNSGSVWTVRDGKLGRKVFIETGITDGSWFELVSGDVQEGDELAAALLVPRINRRRALF